MSANAITGQFPPRHLGSNEDQIEEMLRITGADSLDQLVDRIVPSDIRLSQLPDLAPAMSEFEYLNHIQALADKNKIYRNYIGQGYYGTIMPPVIQRNMLENPGWYTQYTPYQAEISQGRLEALLAFQTVVAELTGMQIANASLLDEATSAAEAVLMAHRIISKKFRKEKRNTAWVDAGVFDQTYDVIQTRAKALGLTVGHKEITPQMIDSSVFAIVLQYPDKKGTISYHKEIIDAAKAHGVMVIVAADILSLAILTPPGEWGADIVVGSTQRLGIPMMYGGPHAGYFATKEDYKRQLPGRIIGVSVDKHGNKALRMALQTREQHIRREKATSNICTAQALLASMAGMYAVYHGPEGLKNIASRIQALTGALRKGLVESGITLHTSTGFFDTLSIEVSDPEAVRRRAEEMEINLFYLQKEIRISLDETTRPEDVRDILYAITGKHITLTPSKDMDNGFQRSSLYLQQEIFSKYHTETEMMRYLKRLENKDLSLVHSMIPLGSCTMKLNAAAEMMPVTWPAFTNMHPFAPQDQVAGYLELIEGLADDLCKITGFTACSFQPNSGAQGEFSGLLAIRRYHDAAGDQHRTVTLIPKSAHGTNPASAVMAGMEVVLVDCDDKGNIIVSDLKEKAEAHKDNLAALMVTYPSTYGVYESAIREICTIIHDNGGLVYMDGANMNAQLCLTNPHTIGADVCHLNLHKTFAIPHGGGGPGVGPICVNDKLKAHLPGHVYYDGQLMPQNGAVSAAPFGSAGILPISYGFIKMMGAQGLLRTAQMAMLNANYMKARLEKDFPILYVGENGYVAHEFIMDLHIFKDIASAEDIAKRLMDYSFHAPTISFPVHGTFMIEPTESESKFELDRFCEAMLMIKAEMEEVVSGAADPEDNVVTNAPHTLMEVTANEWSHPYSREKAAYPVEALRVAKFWPAVGRIDNAYGDRHLQASCSTTTSCV